jgi:hypothetical protein
MRTGSKEDFTMNRSRPWIAGGLLGLVFVLSIAGAASAAPDGRKFGTPDKAIDAFIASVRQYDLKSLVSIFGTGAERIFDTGDAVMDANLRATFLKLYDTKHVVTKRGDGGEVLVVGADSWPFPVPLVQTGHEWVFDTPSGIEEIINRRIGENELEAIQTSLAIGDAEREYYMTDPNGDAVMQYATKFLSSTGKRDGLYWPTKPGEPLSPLGEFAANATEEGYRVSHANPYHGYYFRLLSSQGKSAPGGAYDYMAHGKQIGGYAIVAYPAVYGDTGIMTFMTSHSGIVYQRDLGPSTKTTEEKIKTFDPGPGWTKVPDKDQQPFSPPAD